MSNRLVNLVHRVKGIKGPARAVLLVLADEARDHRGGRSSLTTAQIADRTGFSARTVHRAYVDLADAGHITREAGEPGAAVMTLVHPAIEGVSAAASVSAPPAGLSVPPCQSVRGSYREENKNHNTLPRDHGTCGRAREPAAPAVEVVSEDPVEQVFAAWNAFQKRVGLAPVASVMARRAAVASRVATYGLGSTLMMVDKTERLLRERRAPKGQGDLFWRFDMVFGVGNLATYMVFERMQEGQFDAPAELDPAPTALPSVDQGDDLRNAIVAEIGEGLYQAWVRDCGLAIDGDELVVTAQTLFKADWISQHYASQLRRAASKAAGQSITRITASVGKAEKAAV